jgi:hypothetical protein
MELLAPFSICLFVAVIPIFSFYAVIIAAFSIKLISFFGVIFSFIFLIISFSL